MDYHNTDFEPTRQSLLVRLKNWEDQASWLEFFDQYWRLIYSVARRTGLSEDESQEVVQQTLIALSKSIRTFEYQPKRCLFRSYLLMLTHHRIVGLLRKRYSRRDQTPLSEELEAAVLSEHPMLRSDLDKIWDEEWEKNLITTATDHVKKQIKAKQFQIYDLYVLQRWPVKRVAETLNVSVAQVYMAKHRVGRLMRRAVQTIEKQEQDLPARKIDDLKELENAKDL